MGLMDFGDIRTATKSEMIRAWAVEEAVAWAGSTNGQDLVCVAKMFEDYVTNGDVSGVIQTAVEEGYREGRFEVKQVAEEWFSNIDLDVLFKAKGGIDQKGMSDGPR
jgi:hypothetical protein